MGNAIQSYRRVAMNVVRGNSYTATSLDFHVNNSSNKEINIK